MTNERLQQLHRDYDGWLPAVDEMLAALDRDARDLLAARADNARLREALEWYANTNNCRHAFGQIARAALKGIDKC